MQAVEGDLGQADDDVGEPRFLPPQPPGPEPELGDRPAPEPARQQPPPPPPQAPPGQTYGYPPPPPGYAHPPQQPQQPYAPQWGYAQPPVPDNGQAVAGFVCSIIAICLLFISFGLSTIVSLGLAIAGIVCSRNGKRKVDAGETPKHRGLAQAGLIVGWVALGFSILAIVAWTLVFVFETDWEGIRIDPEETRSAAARALWG